jgi:hypothetical protein
MRHAVALSRCINVVTGKYLLTREVMKDKQDSDLLCRTYNTCENFWLDKDQLLYSTESDNYSSVVVPESLIETF